MNVYATRATKKIFEIFFGRCSFYSCRWFFAFSHPIFFLRAPGTIKFRKPRRIFEDTPSVLPYDDGSVSGRTLERNLFLEEFLEPILKNQPLPPERLLKLFKPEPTSKKPRKKDLLSGLQEGKLLFPRVINPFDPESIETFQQLLREALQDHLKGLSSKTKKHFSL